MSFKKCFSVLSTRKQEVLLHIKTFQTVFLLLCFDEFHTGVQNLKAMELSKFVHMSENMKKKKFIFTRKYFDSLQCAGIQFKRLYDLRYRAINSSSTKSKPISPKVLLGPSKGTLT